MKTEIRKKEKAQVQWCKRCRVEARMKTENREKEYTGLMESLESRTVRGRDREREKQTNYIPKNSNSKYSVLQVCVFNAHVLYKSF